MFRILWTRLGTEGGWYNDVAAPDAATAAWEVAVHALPAQDGTAAVLVSVIELGGGQAPAAEVPRGDGG